MRLIDAEVLANWIDGSQRLDTEHDYEEVARYIEECPTVDAVPVVRCKDCKWRPRNMGKDIDVHHLEFPCGADSEEVCPYSAGDPWYNKEPSPAGYCHLGSGR